MTNQEGAGVKRDICPESTIESANRRSFIRKAAIATAAVGIGSSAIGKNIVLESSARSNCYTSCYLYVKCQIGIGTFTPPSCTQLCVVGKVRACCVFSKVVETSTLCAITNCKFATAIIAQSPSNGLIASSEQLATLCCPPTYYGGCQPGVWGQSFSGPGVKGSSACGPGLLGSAGTYSSIPIVAKGYVKQTAPLQEWQNSCGTPLAVINNAGSLGLGTATPSTPLDVVGVSPLIGTFKSNAASGDRSALVQFANADSTAVDWNLGVAGKCNSIKVPDGYFYVQHSTSTTPAISVNKCNNHVGIGIANPCRVLCVNGRIHTQCGMGLGTQTINTTLAINGSVSMKSRQVSSTATLALSDYAVVADAASAAFTITLPAVSSTAGACNGMVLFIKKIDSSTNAVTVAVSGTDTIEGNSSVVLKKQYDSLQLISNNSSGRHEWFILQSAKCGALLT
jgi:hypothetical protein